MPVVAVAFSARVLESMPHEQLKALHAAMEAAATKARAIPVEARIK